MDGSITILGADKLSINNCEETILGVMAAYRSRPVGCRIGYTRSRVEYTGFHLNGAELSGSPGLETMGQRPKKERVL
jgi:hypothetical protein